MSKIQLDIGGAFFDAPLYGIDILKCSQEHCSPKKAVEKRIRDYYSLHFVTHGKGVLRSAAGEFFIGQGEAFLLYGGEEYTYHPDGADPWSYIWIDFKGESADSLFAACNLTREKPHCKVARFTELVGTLKQLVDSYNASALQQLLCSGYFLVVLGQMAESTLAQRNGNFGYSEKFRHVREALIYINNNYRLDLTVEDIAANVHISPSHLMNLFAEQLELSPIQYVNMFRVATACMHLRKPNVRVSEAANMVGFNDPLYFSRIFSKLKGMSPREYAKRETVEDPFEFLKQKNIDFR